MFLLVEQVVNLLIRMGKLKDGASILFSEMLEQESQNKSTDDNVEVSGFILFTFIPSHFFRISLFIPFPAIDNRMSASECL